VTIDFDKVRASGGKVYTCCPYCQYRKTEKPFEERADTQNHLLVNIFKNFYYCFRCGVQGELKDLDSLIDLHLDIDRYDLTNIKNRLSKLSFPEFRKPIVFEQSEIGDPIVRGSDAFEYLCSRNITEDQINHYKLLSGKNNLKERIVIPEYKNSSIIYFTARSYRHAIPKYVNAAVPKTDIVYNINNVTTDHCILCEGCFSAIAAGESGIAVLGKKLSFSQYQQISYRFKTVLVCLDPDVSIKDRERVRNTFLRYGCNAGVVVGLDGDPNEVSPEIFKSACEKSQVFKPEQLPFLMFRQ